MNGQRESANYFSVNGTDSEEGVNDGSAIVRNLDAIAEFRILTGNFDAEYGEFSGGQINVVTKSGSNEFHGDAFEFLRNTDLDARNYFSPTRGAFRQNQFGGTLGGPVRHDKIFFFTDYQGTRQTQGVDTGMLSVPSNADRVGNLADLAGNLTGTVSGPYFAELLTQKLGYTVASGERYYTPGCNGSAECVFPNATIPQNVWAAPAQRLLQYIPAPNSVAGTFSTSAYNQTLRDDTNLGQPTGGRNVSLASQGFANADGKPSIVALDPKGQSVENVNFNAYSIGAAVNELIQVNNTYQVSDTFTRVLGNHILKFGGNLHFDQVNANAIAQFNATLFSPEQKREWTSRIS